ncbi:MAG: hypothetical protein MN733_33075 [Nitrososphaera sp.]|nr:hypothetical protein [Nitrososphaera sp.]
MNAALFNIVNGIATSARATNDQDSMALCEEIIQRASFVFGTTYDAAASSASPVYITANPYPAGEIAPSYDTMSNVGVTNIRNIGG